LRKAFALSERASFALQGQPLGGEAMEGPERRGEGYETRAAIGTSFSMFGQEGFVNVEGARPFRGDGYNRWIAEIATGLEFVPGWNLTLKSWTQQGDDARSTKAEAVSDNDFFGIRVGAGWCKEISGEFEEKGWVMSARATF
jgi:hypothetical protein